MFLGLSWLTVCALLHHTASLRFQPTKRPQLSAQKPKPKPSTPRPPTAAPTTQPDAIPSESAGVTARPSAKITLADWTAEGHDDDVNGFYCSEKRQRGGKKKRKKNKEEAHAPQNWDDVYDPCRPNNYEDYKHSDEKIVELKEWKDKLYAHRLAKRRNSESGSSDNEHKPLLNSMFPLYFEPVDAKSAQGNSRLQVRLSRLLHYLMMEGQSMLRTQAKVQTTELVMISLLEQRVSLLLVVWQQNLSTMNLLLIKQGR